MYNYQTFLRQNKFKQKCQQIRKQRHQFSYHKQSSRSILLRKNTIYDTISQEKSISIYFGNGGKATSYLIVSEQPLQTKVSKQIENNGENSFLYESSYLQRKDLSKSIMIKEQSKKNMQLDQVPFWNPSFHNFRQHTRSDLKPFKYTPLNSSMRVKQSLQKASLNYLDLNFNKKVQVTLKSNPKKLYTSNYLRNNKNLTKMVNKTLFPQLHQKTHFQSIKTIYSESPCSFLKICITNEKQNATNQAYEQQTEIQTRKQIEKITNDHANRRENSKQALIKCGLLKIRKDEKNGLNPSPSVTSVYR